MASHGKSSASVMCLILGYTQFKKDVGQLERSQKEKTNRDLENMYRMD